MCVEVEGTLVNSSPDVHKRSLNLLVGLVFSKIQQSTQVTCTFFVIGSVVVRRRTVRLLPLFFSKLFRRNWSGILCRGDGSSGKRRKKWSDRKE